MHLSIFSISHVLQSQLSVSQKNTCAFLSNKSKQENIKVHLYQLSPAMLLECFWWHKSIQISFCFCFLLNAKTDRTIFVPICVIKWKALIDGTPFRTCAFEHQCHINVKLISKITFLKKKVKKRRHVHALFKIKTEQ